MFHLNFISTKSELRKSPCNADKIRVVLYATKIGIVDNKHFSNGTIQIGVTLLGADSQCLHENLHTGYSKWLEDHIQTLLDNLPLGMKMHR